MTSAEQQLQALELQEARQRLETAEMLLAAETRKSDKLKELLATAQSIRIAMKQERDELHDRCERLEETSKRQAAQLALGSPRKSHAASTSPPRLTACSPSVDPNTSPGAVVALTAVIERLKRENGELRRECDALKIELMECKAAAAGAASSGGGGCGPSREDSVASVTHAAEMLTLRRTNASVTRQLEECEAEIRALRAELARTREHPLHQQRHTANGEAPAESRPPRRQQSYAASEAASPVPALPVPQSSRAATAKATGAEASSTFVQPPWRGPGSVARGAARCTSPWARSPRDCGRAPGTISSRVRRSPSNRSASAVSQSSSGAPDAVGFRTQAAPPAERHTTKSPRKQPQSPPRPARVSSASPPRRQRAPGSGPGVIGARAAAGEPDVARAQSRRIASLLKSFAEAQHEPALRASDPPVLRPRSIRSTSAASGASTVADGDS